MKTLYLDLTMGAAGDMLTAALLELAPDPRAALEMLNGLNIPNVVFEAEKGEKMGVPGTHMKVLVHGEEEGDRHHHTHRTLTDVARILDNLNASPWVRDQAKQVYRRIARAEGAVHGEPVTLVHFHEVGALDAIADVAAVCALLELLAPETICASPVHTGYGTVRCAHGELPVPAPATALLLQGIPSRPGDVKGELCTPTGAALVGQFAEHFGALPEMRPAREGVGLGKKNFEKPNCLRAILGE